MEFIRKVAKDCGYHEDVVKEIFDHTISTILAHTADGGCINLPKFGRFKRYTNKTGTSHLEFLPRHSTIVRFNRENEINRLRHIKW